MILDKKINSLKNIIFIKGSLCVGLVGVLMFVISSLQEDYDDTLHSLALIKPAIIETKIKLHEITDSGYAVAEGVAKFNEIYNKTEEMRCKEFQEILLKIEDLRNKYALPNAVIAKMSSVPTKNNVVHNKNSYINTYDLKIDFSSYDLAEAFSIYKDILSLLPEYSIIYSLSVKETMPIHSGNIKSLRSDLKLTMFKCKIYIRMRDVVFARVNR